MASTQGGIHTRAGAGPKYWGPGDVYTFLVTGEQSGGACFVMEALVPPGGGPPPHVHSREDESFYVLEGRCSIQVGETIYAAEQGDYVFIPRGTPHSFINDGEEPMRMIITCTPAGIEGFFREVFAPVTDPSAEPPEMSDEMLQRFLEAAPRYGLEFVRAPEGG